MISLDFLHGKITYDEFSSLQNLSAEHQLQNLKEDMLQIEYPNGFLLDVGWYPSFDIEGCFQVKIIKDFDWDSPTLSLTSKSIESICSLLDLAQNKINEELKNKTTINYLTPQLTQTR
ncbi:hypothetical protein PSH61_08340 [Pseudomonas rhodesiae]|uniref:hypothetical protein n=1 Tax=Pseudomonas rhodesiae TaxID=76760 RepID=UPI002734C48B|nr:hypothetical protein [Pseudomonas rhodesiae]WLI31106.1 hypothetical protein PSH61_08340 [Pseudomonas rhodesiae]